MERYRIVKLVETRQNALLLNDKIAFAFVQSAITSNKAFLLPKETTEVGLPSKSLITNFLFRIEEGFDTTTGRRVLV